MDVFISWSGQRSQQLAKALHDWLPNVIQAIRPYMSTESIRKGASWFEDIGQRLQDADFGIICVTPENQNEPWLLYEAGALAKKSGENRAAPLILGMKDTDLAGPLSLTQATSLDKDDMLRLLQTINGLSEGRRLNDEQLSASLERWWADLASEIESIKHHPGPVKVEEPRADRDLLEELVELTRRLNRSATRQELRQESHDAHSALQPTSARQVAEYAARARAVDRALGVAQNDNKPYLLDDETPMVRLARQALDRRY